MDEIDQPLGFVKALLVDMVDRNSYDQGLKWSSLMATTATRPDTAPRLKSREKSEVTAFAGNAQKFSQELTRVFQVPPSSKEDAMILVRAVDELQKKIQVLRDRLQATPVGAPRTSTTAAKPTSTRTPLVLDTTEAMIDKGQLVDPVKFQEIMGWKTRQAVWKAAADNRVFFMEHQAERYFPAFYADQAYQRMHLEAVTKILGDLPGGSKLQFFLTRKGSLGGKTPLEALATGGLAKVKDVASAFAEVPMEA